MLADRRQPDGDGDERRRGLQLRDLVPELLLRAVSCKSGVRRGSGVRRDALWQRCGAARSGLTELEWNRNGG